MEHSISRCDLYTTFFSHVNLSLSIHMHCNIPPIREFIYRLTVKFFNSCPTHLNPLISSIGNYSLAGLHCQ